jgi:hypothetical protein
MSRTPFLGLIFTLVALAGCGQNFGSGGGGSTAGPGELALLITDAPFPHDAITSAHIMIDRIALDRGLEDGGTTRIVLHDGPPLGFELTSLCNGTFGEMLRTPLPSGEYFRVFLNFASVELALEDGRVFRSGDGTLQVPELGPEGFVVPLDTVLRVPQGDWARLLLDFDLTRSFQPIGGSFEDATSFSFQPVIYAIMPGQSAEVRGVVARRDPQGGMHPVDRATVFFLPVGIKDLDQAIASTASDEDGGYSQLGLPPGAYRVVAIKGTRQTWLETARISAGNYAAVDLTFD